MILADTNIFIYIAQAVLTAQTFHGQAISCSIVTTIEALGYHKLPVEELRTLERLFAGTAALPINDDIVEQAILLRQSKKMELGDAIIAATALVNDLELWTTNVKDFRHIDGLRLVNPLESPS